MDKQLEQRLRRLTRPGLVEVASLVEELLSVDPEAPEVAPRQDRVVVEIHKARGVTLQLEKVRCGKAGCKSCPHPKDGAGYWYAYYREGGRLRSKYIGKLRATAFNFAEQKASEGRQVGGKDFLGNAEDMEDAEGVT